MQWLCAWLADTQGVKTLSEDLEEPARVTARIGASAGKAAEALPFDADPTGFTAYLEALAVRRSKNV